jgi:hypothetical protein
MWKCRKCGLERARRQYTECEDGGEHDWDDRDEVNVEIEQENEIRRREAELRREEAGLKYLTFLNSASGQERLAEIANGYLARRKTASIGSLMLGLLTVFAFPVGCVTFPRLLGLDTKGVLTNLITFSIYFYFPYLVLWVFEKTLKITPLYERSKIPDMY